MSFDPFGKPEPGEPSRDYPMEPEPVDGPSAKAGSGYVLPPAILLIVLGLVNLLWAGYCGFVWTRLANATPEMREEFTKTYKEMMRRQKPEDVAQMEAQGYTPEWVFGAAVQFYLWTAIPAMLASVLMIVGGIRMIQLRSYALCILGALAAAIPWISLSACCCIGEGVGLWALIVLIMEDVRRAFR